MHGAADLGVVGLDVLEEKKRVRLNQTFGFKTRKV